MSERASSNAAFDQPALEPCGDPGVRPELRIPDGAAKTRMVSVARIRPDSRKSVRPFKGIICADISEFESYMPSHAVRSPSAKMRVVPTLPQALASRGMPRRFRSHDDNGCDQPRHEGVAIRLNGSAQRHGKWTGSLGDCLSSTGFGHHELRPNPVQPTYRYCESGP